MRHCNWYDWFQPKETCHLIVNLLSHLSEKKNKKTSHSMLFRVFLSHHLPICFVSFQRKNRVVFGRAAFNVTNVGWLVGWCLDRRSPGLEPSPTKASRRSETTHGGGVFVKKLGGGNSNIFGIFTPYVGKWSNLTIIFFKGVETTNQLNNHTCLVSLVFLGWFFVVVIQHHTPCFFCCFFFLGGGGGCGGVVFLGGPSS